MNGIVKFAIIIYCITIGRFGQQATNTTATVKGQPITSTTTTMKSSPTTDVTTGTISTEKSHPVIKISPVSEVRTYGYNNYYS